IRMGQAWHRDVCAALAPGRVSSATSLLKAILTPLAIAAKRFNETALALRHKHRLAVVAAKSEVRGLLATQHNFVLKRAIGRHDRDLSFANAGDQQPAVHVGA